MGDCAEYEWSRNSLEELYGRYNRREFVHPDPLEFLYEYEDPRDREIVGLVAASLAYGRVVQILRSVSGVLHRMGPSPCRFLQSSSRNTLHRLFSGFKHRFTTEDQLCALLLGVKQVAAQYGSLNQCFVSNMNKTDGTVLPALAAFVQELSAAGGEHLGGMFLPSPCRGSACKRLNLFLRWMVRYDAVDPGGWNGIPSSMLIVPLDTHMYRIGRKVGFISRKQADMRAALEFTDAFRSLTPEDPVRYDFSLTRPGIRGKEEKA